MAAMTTQHAITELNDGPFHQLGDELLRRIDPRYRALRTHGLNERGESVKGQPDSYVGDSAQSCTIAVCYTVQRRSWWGKVVSDLKEVRSACPHAREIIVVVARDVDREGPRTSIETRDYDWINEARKAAGTDLRVIDRKELAAYLDAEHQDLRYRYLQIPYSRLNAAGILASTQAETQRAVDEIKASGRYVTNGYVPRSADRDLYRFWQESFEKEMGGDQARPRLIPLITDSGLGKTSLVCRFTESLVGVLPVLLLQARDISFLDEDSLTRHVISRLQGVIDPKSVVLEEAAVVRHIVGGIPFTLVVDGLDEVHEPEPVRRALTFWLRSRLGAVSTLVVTARPEFWRTCADPSWKSFIPSTSRSPTNLLDTETVRPTEIAGGICIPERFTEEELQHAWEMAGYSCDHLYALPRQSRMELTHPFTLRAYLDLVKSYGKEPLVINRTALLEAWLMSRLDREVHNSQRISRELLLEGLRLLASSAAKAPGGLLSIDALTHVPRFDPAHPPGPVVERLIAANLLQCMPSRTDHVRFTIEAVQDFCEAWSVIEEIGRSPIKVAQRFAKMRFTDAQPKLDHLRSLLTGLENERIFLRKLAQLDVAMAAVLLEKQHGEWDDELRLGVADAFGAKIDAPYLIQRAFAIQMLGRLGDVGSGVIVRSMKSAGNLPRSLKRTAALALHKAQHAPSAAFVYRWGPYWVSRDLDSYYFRDNLALARRSREDFRLALSTCAHADLAQASGTTQHALAVSALAHLQDHGLAPHLAERLEQNGVLNAYENHALFALGTASAAQVFKSSAVRATSALESMNGRDDSEQRALYYSIHLHSSDIKYLITLHFVNVLRELLHSECKSAAYLALDLAIRASAADLLGDVAQTQARLRVIGGLEFPRDAISPDVWLLAWARAEDDRSRERLLRCFPAYPTVRVEEELIQCLGNAALQNGAAHALEHYGSRRALPRLREVLRSSKDYDPWRLRNVVLALGGFRDEFSIRELKQLALATESEVRSVAIRALAEIGSPDAEAALLEIFGSGTSFNRAAAALILCGRSSAVSAVLEQVSKSPSGQKTLCEILKRLTWDRGHRAGEYFTHIDDELIVSHLAGYQPTSPSERWDLLHAIDKIDGPAIRKFMRSLLQKAGTVDDAALRDDDKYTVSSYCRAELALRGDEFAIPYVLDVELRETKPILARLTHHLQNFRPVMVVEELRRRLAMPANIQVLEQIIELIGHYGNTVDAALLEPYESSEQPSVANAAHAARMLLIDPLRIPDGWRLI